MKAVIWTDDDGIKHRSFITEDMTDSEAPSGYVSDPPDVINEINWQEVAKDLQNNLVDRGLFTYRQMRTSQNGLSGAVLAALKRKVAELYRRK